MTTECCSCGKELDESEPGQYLNCKFCNKSTPRGANFETRNPGVKKEVKEKKPKIKKINPKAKYVKCCKCGELRFTRPEVYEQRIKKFGSEEKMQKEYVCRSCRKEVK
jgi:hypothetical protein